MHTHDLSPWQHTHVFGEVNRLAERGTRAVVAITVAMMVVEIVAGWWFNSMALLADGWHMSSHAIAIGLSAVAYLAARRFARDPRFAFGTWKIEILGGYTSALCLVGVALFMVIGSTERLLAPQVIRFDEAILVAVLGLAVNLVCAVILGGAHEHGHEHHHDHDHDHHEHHDVNLRSAYVHVITDAMTSVFAIVALLGGKYWGWVWLDPVMGLVGAALVAAWAWGLLRDSGRVLLDYEANAGLADELRRAVERLPGDTRVADLHLWRVGGEKFGCILSVVTDDRTLAVARVKELLSGHEELAHVSVEINLCDRCRTK